MKQNGIFTIKVSASPLLARWAMRLRDGAVTLVLATIIGAMSYVAFPDIVRAASGIAPQPCDPKYWETMSARAWMEAEREIMQNQNLIFKPDSVLEYTCFDNLVSHGAKHLGDVFVHTDYFGKVIIERGSAQAQEVALQNVVTTALKDYLANNYPYNFLADRSPKLKNKPNPTNRAGSDLKDATSMANYSGCKIMAEVWKASKCINFIDNEEFENTDGFYPFITLEPGPGGGQPVLGYNEYGDVRYWPTPCDQPMEGQEWVDQDDIATNKDDQKYDFREPLKKDFEDVRKMVEPGECGPALETGVTVILSGASGTGDPDMVCTNPGCTFIGGECQ